MPTAADLVRRFYDEVWNRQDEAVARAILHRDFRFRGSLGPELRGRDAFLDYLCATHRALGDYTCIVEDLIATADRAAARMTFTGVHRAPFFGVAATGRAIGWAGAAFFTANGERIVALWVLGDIDGLKRQLGAVPESQF
jgi:steroid delta-isomerase-like uncharacterized protein